MKPILINIGAIPIRSWGVMVAIGILFGLYIARRLAIKKGIDGDKILNLGFYIVVAGLLCGRIVFVLLDLPYFLADPLQIIMINQGGLSIQGAILGGFIAGYFFCRYHKLNFARVADAFGPPLILGQAIGRIGCFLGGHCEGTVTNFFLKVKFPMLAGFRHPVQLYEMALDLIAFGFILVFRNKFKKDGSLFATSIIIISAVRFVLDFVRESDSLVLGLSYAQVFSLMTILVFAFYLGRNKLFARSLNSST